jgi:hypothetical protein
MLLAFLYSCFDWSTQVGKYLKLLVFNFKKYSFLGS